MKCENCIACKTYFNGLEVVAYCEVGISEEEACHDDRWYCNLNQQTINKRLRDKNMEICKQWENINV